MKPEEEREWFEGTDRESFAATMARNDRGASARAAATP